MNHYHFLLFSKNDSFKNNSVSLRFMFYLLKANCRYNQLISNGDLYHRGQFRENLDIGLKNKITL